MAARPMSTHKLMRRDDGLLDVKAMTREQFFSWFLAEVDESETRAMLVFKHLWQQGTRSFEDMVGVTPVVRRKLAKLAYVSFLEPELVLRSQDGAVKYVWRLEDGRQIESVLIPDDDRVTLCVSSQVGCAMACTFCLTGDLGLKRHLKPSEIANQALQVGLQMPDGGRITNIVMMGMGEPLHNFENLVEALEVCLDDNALNFSHRKITVSTVGLVPKMEELAERLPVNLAVSLNATTESQRLEIMPITKRYSMKELLDACKNVKLPRNKRITFEYVMFQGFNDDMDDVARLYELLKDVPTKVNLIPYNENPDRAISRPMDERVQAFKEYLMSRGMNCSVRTTRGLDISAACGQLGKGMEQAIDRGWLARARELAGLSA